MEKFELFFPSAHVSRITFRMAKFPGDEHIIMSNVVGDEQNLSANNTVVTFSGSIYKLVSLEVLNSHPSTVPETNYFLF